MLQAPRFRAIPSTSYTSNKITWLKKPNRRRSQRNPSVVRKRNAGTQNIDKPNTRRDAIVRTYQITSEQEQPEIGTNGDKRKHHEKTNTDDTRHGPAKNNRARTRWKSEPQKYDLSNKSCKRNTRATAFTGRNRTPEATQ